MEICIREVTVHNLAAVRPVNLHMVAVRVIAFHAADPAVGTLTHGKVRRITGVVCVHLQVLDARVLSGSGERCGQRGVGIGQIKPGGDAYGCPAHRSNLDNLAKHPRAVPPYSTIAPRARPKVASNTHEIGVI